MFKQNFDEGYEKKNFKTICFCRCKFQQNWSRNELCVLHWASGSTISLHYNLKIYVFIFMEFIYIYRIEKTWV